MKKPIAVNLQSLTIAHLYFSLFIGFVAGVAYSFGGLIYDAANGSINEGTALAFLALVGMPAVFGLTGLLIGFAEALFLALLSKITKNVIKIKN